MRGSICEVLLRARTNARAKSWTLCWLPMPSGRQLNLGLCARLPMPSGRQLAIHGWHHVCKHPPVSLTTLWIWGRFSPVQGFLNDLAIPSRMIDLMSIVAAPLSAHRARLAHAEGLLVLLHAGDSAKGPGLTVRRSMRHHQRYGHVLEQFAADATQQTGPCSISIRPRVRAIRERGKMVLSNAFGIIRRAKIPCPTVNVGSAPADRGGVHSISCAIRVRAAGVQAKAASPW
jgi:hypothetical protein